MKLLATHLRRCRAVKAKNADAFRCRTQPESERGCRVAVDELMYSVSGAATGDEVHRCKEAGCGEQGDHRNKHQKSPIGDLGRQRDLEESGAFCLQ